MSNIEEIQNQINELSDELMNLPKKDNLTNFDKEFEIKRKVQALQWKLDAACAVERANKHAEDVDSNKEYRNNISVQNDKRLEQIDVYQKDLASQQEDRKQRFELYEQDVKGAIEHRKALKGHLAIMENIWERIATALEKIANRAGHDKASVSSE